MTDPSVSPSCDLTRSSVFSAALSRASAALRSYPCPWGGVGAESQLIARRDPRRRGLVFLRQAQDRYSPAMPRRGAGPLLSADASFFERVSEGPLTPALSPGYWGEGGRARPGVTGGGF